MSSNKDVSPSTSARSINIETPGTYCIYRADTSDEKSSLICNSPSELRQMNPVTSHVTAPPTTSSSCRSSNIYDFVLFNFFLKHRILRFDFLTGSVLDVSEATFDMKAFEKKMYSLNQEISSKLDMIIMNLCRLNRFLLPHEKRIIRPADLPALPLTTEKEFEKFEKYLSNDDNAGATVNKYFSLLLYIHLFLII